MAPAFSHFAEPVAWLIRGFVEYGWPDTTTTNGLPPPGAFGGMDLSHLPGSQGRDGVILDVAATVNGQTVAEDGRYQFQVVLYEGDEQQTFVVRCPEANFFQEFPYDPANPLWAAGYIHQAIQEYVPKFVQWRLEGGEVSWTQRQGLPSVEAAPCSALLCSFIKERHAVNRTLDDGPTEGWWLGGAQAPVAQASPVAAANPDLSGQRGVMAQPVEPAPVEPAPASAGFGQPIASTGRGDGPTYISAAGRAATEAQAGGVIIPGQAQSYATSKVRAPAIALMAQAAFGTLHGFLWLFNGVWTIVNDRGAFLALLVSIALGPLLIIGGAASAWGAICLLRLKPGFFPWVSVVYAALCGLGCIVTIPLAFVVHVLAGLAWAGSGIWALPIAVWAGLVIRRPDVSQVRQVVAS